MRRGRSVLVFMLLVALAVAACDRLEDPATLLDGGNALSSSEAAKTVVEELQRRVFIDKAGFTHTCSEFVSSMVFGSWESDSESWLLTFTATSQPGTRIFRFYEVDSTFDQVAGPPLADACLAE